MPVRALLRVDPGGLSLQSECLLGDKKSEERRCAMHIWILEAVSAVSTLIVVGLGAYHILKKSGD